MDDTGASGSVSDDALTQFIVRLETLAGDYTQKITLVFLGDVLELLRSPSWEIFWNKHKSAPWSGMGVDLSDFSKRPRRENCHRDRPRHLRPLSELLSEAQNVRAARHDQNKIHLRQSRLHGPAVAGVASVVEFLTLSHDRKKPFQLSYSDKIASVFATLRVRRDSTARRIQILFEQADPVFQGLRGIEWESFAAEGLIKRCIV